MAILFGTTADGESLPVQVNEFGQLVAKGLPGPQGEQGEQGEPGPVGDVEFTHGSFTPEFVSSDPAGAGFLTYDRQAGYWYRFGPLLTVSVYLRTTSVSLTNIRGYTDVGGLPAGVAFAMPNSATEYGPFSINYLRSEAKGLALGGRIGYVPTTNHFRPIGYWDGTHQYMNWADLDSPNGTQNAISMSWMGIAADAVRSVPSSLDELM